jgi:hypothetical protein
VLSLPSKPWKKVRIVPLEKDGFRVTILSELKSQAEFDEIIEEDIVASLGEHGRVVTRDWPSRCVDVSTPELGLFKRNLIFASVMIEIP